MKATLNVEHQVAHVGCAVKGQSGRMDLWLHVQLEGLWKFLSNCQSGEESETIHLAALASPFHHFFNRHAGANEPPCASMNDHTLLL